ncbi:MAG TPA: class I SAM-dependent methyltransferase [Spirochaetota bacterium]|nr:class I SAM-dependent methyltransferase [Spirochaetota bacterium]HPJ33627.1 class I SAM-dependent methyltransferase [Spirochaetota bacterium]
MDRLKRLQEWSIYEYGKRFFIEPESRHDIVMSKIRDVVTTYKPKVIVKAGLGSGTILIDLINELSDVTLVVVEPSLKIIEQFIEANSDNEKVKDVGFINGDFRNFPVDYYASDLIISIDNLDIQETAPVIDEFRRALQFDGYLLFAGVVLEDDDIDGVYDDFMRGIFPLHNDYYIKDDLKTFLNLKDFSFIKGKGESFEYNIDEIVKHIKELYGDTEFDPASFIEENHAAFSELYQMSEKKIFIPYFTGLFMRRKIN